MLQRMGVDSRLIRNLQDWQRYEALLQGCRGGLIIPGGESTAMMKIMHDEGLMQPIRRAIWAGLPTFGTCAGLILLDDCHLAVMDITVRRNAYGRQLGSFQASSPLQGIATAHQPFPMVFIRAPYIEHCGQQVQVLSVLDGHIVAARQDNRLVCSFHPELTTDTRVHQYFLEMILS